MHQSEEWTSYDLYPYARMESRASQIGVSEDFAQSSSATADDDQPACQSCRRRKLKCSREIPTCSQCTRLVIECTYTPTRKSGMKPGAIEGLNQRLLIVEEKVLGQGSLENQIDEQVSLAFARELQKIGAHSLQSTPHSVSPTIPHTRPSKRRRAEHLEEVDEDDVNIVSALPQRHVLDAVVDTYFQNQHHWIPFLHQSRFRRRLFQDGYSSRNAVVLHAMVCSTLKLLRTTDFVLGGLDVQRQIRQSRHIVIINAMSRPSIEHVQALIIISFDHIGSGDVEKAWSIVGSLTRTIEYLRLTAEPDSVQEDPLRRPITLLDPPTSWTEVEQRRRLFWNVFLLDRFCSVTTGWSTSLTSDDVHRKLPCDGGLWAREERSDTPYFGIWNKSAAKIGNSIAFIPAHYPASDQEIEHDCVRSPGNVSSTTTVDTSKLGAFAYCIEATESLSQVTTFFLQQKVDFQNRHEVGSWLTRFKELDLRLVHWKMFLPPRWKDSNVSRDDTVIEMDPNLTLAHLTHNTSMILLHQHIAYPPPSWKDLVKLPSGCSAETCQLAAIETASITQKYLTYTTIGIVNSQFALCAFVAARILLVHWRFYDVELEREFFALVKCLKEMSQRWQGLLDKSSTTIEMPRPALDLAGLYAGQLEQFHIAFSQQPGFCMNVLGYNKDPTVGPVDCLLPCTPSFSLEMIPHSANTQHMYTNRATSRSAICPRRRAAEKMQGNIREMDHGSPVMQQRASQSRDHRNLQTPRPFQMTSAIRSQMVTEFDPPSVEDELTIMSNVLLGQQFLDMDRVITYNDTNFAIDLDGWSNMG